MRMPESLEGIRIDTIIGRHQVSKDTETAILEATSYSSTPWLVSKCWPKLQESVQQEILSLYEKKEDT